MNVKQLKEVLNKYPDDMNICVEFNDGWDTFICKNIDYKISCEYEGCYGTDKDCIYIVAQNEY